MYYICFLVVNAGRFCNTKLREKYCTDVDRMCEYVNYKIHANRFRLGSRWIVQWDYLGWDLVAGIYFICCNR